jgi:hypothetical protein
VHYLHKLVLSYILTKPPINASQAAQPDVTSCLPAELFAILFGQGFVLFECVREVSRTIVAGYEVQPTSLRRISNRFQRSFADVRNRRRRQTSVFIGIVG